MCKRLISFLLVVSIFVFAVFPVSASPSGFVDILGFNPSVSSSVYLAPGATQSIYFSIPDNISGSLFEVLYKASGSVDVYANWGGKNFICQDSSIDKTSNIYYGFATLDNTYRNTLTLVIVNTSGSAVTFDCLSATLSPFKIGGKRPLSSYKFKQSSNPSLTGSFGSFSKTVIIGPPAVQLAERVFDGEITFAPEEWLGLDYIHFNFTITCANLSSVSAYVDGFSVPVEMNMLDTGIGQLGIFNVSFVLDLTSIPVQFFKESKLSIYFSGNGSANSNTIFLYRGAWGLVDLDSDRSFFSYWFSQIGSYLTNLGSTISASFSQYFGELHSWFTNLSAYIGNLFTVQLYKWISNFSASVSQGFDRVVNALLGDTPESEEIGEEAGQQGENLDNLNQQMNDYEKPDPGSMNIDIQVDPAGLGFISGGLGGIYQSSIFGQILTMIGILGLAGYVFFGKR